MIAAVGGLLLFFFLVMSLSNRYNLNNIKDKTVGHGQHGTARWATKKEIKRIYKHINYEPDKWREDPDSRPKEQGIVVGCTNRKLTIFTNFMRISFAVGRTRNISPNRFRKARPQQWLIPEMCMR